jgi:hypothetical protein
MAKRRQVIKVTITAIIPCGDDLDGLREALAADESFRAKVSQLAADLGINATATSKRATVAGAEA